MFLYLLFCAWVVYVCLAVGWCCVIAVGFRWLLSVWCLVLDLLVVVGCAFVLVVFVFDVCRLILYCLCSWWGWLCFVVCLIAITCYFVLFASSSFGCCLLVDVLGLLWLEFAWLLGCCFVLVCGLGLFCGCLLLLLALVYLLWVLLCVVYCCLLLVCWLCMFALRLVVVCLPLY